MWHPDYVGHISQTSNPCNPISLVLSSSINTLSIKPRSVNLPKSRNPFITTESDAVCRNCWQVSLEQNNEGYTAAGMLENKRHAPLYLVTESLLRIY
jgi:hypothetical protein